MVYITGDIHGDVSRVREMVTKYTTTSEDTIVLLGDVGMNYYGNKHGDRHRKKKLNSLGIKILCIHGNHEMRPESLITYREDQWHDGTVYVEEEFPNLLFAKDGEVYDLEGCKAIAIGVGLCIFAVLPLVVAGMLDDMGASVVVAACFMALLLVFVSSGVYLFISRGLVRESFSKLLQTGDFTPEKKVNGKTIEKISGIYWCVVTAIFLAWSFLTNDWGITWVIWPVAGVLFGGIACAVHLYKRK